MPQFDEYTKISPFEIPDNLGNQDQVGLLKSLTRRIIDLEMKLLQQEKLNAILWERVKSMMEDAGVIDNITPYSATNMIENDFGVLMFNPSNGGTQFA